MKQESAAGVASEVIASTLNGIETENPHLKEVLQAFRGILIAQARWKAELPAMDGTQIGPPDPERFGKGVPLTDREWLSRLGDLWPTAAERMIPALIVGFPKIHQELEQLQTAILQRAFSPDLFLSAVFGCRTADARKQAELLGLATDLLEFVLTQAARPIVEKRAEMLAPLIDGLTWNKGSCPICGSFPGLSMLKEKAGQRWLRCGFCATTWRFHRTCCPSCEAQAPGDIEIIFVDGREHERVEACHKCRAYITGIDLRNLAHEVVLEVAGFGLMHLDAIAQEKGFMPINSSGPRFSPSPDGAIQLS